MNTEGKFEIEKNELLFNLKQSDDERWYDNYYIRSQIQLLIHAIETNGISLENRKVRQEYKQKRNKEVSKHQSDRKEKYIEYLNSAQWKSFRKQIIDERGNCCENCGNRETLQVHHKHYLNIFNEQREDVLLLCRKCHKRLHAMKPKNRKKFEFKIDSKKSAA